MNAKKVGDSPLYPHPLSCGEGLHFLSPREGGPLDCLWTSLQGSLSHYLGVRGVYRACAEVPWPRNAQAGIPNPGPRGTQGVPAGPLCLRTTTRKFQSPMAKRRFSRPPEGLVRKEGNAARLPQADCFPCSCDKRGNTASAPLLQQGKGRWNRHATLNQGINTISHKPDGPTT